jgi:transposase
VFDPVVAKLEADNARLRVLIEAQAEKLRAQEILIAELRSRLEELQAHIAQDSGTSSLPPSRDRTDRRARRAAEAKERREARKALGAEARKPGKQKGAPGSTLPRRDPERIVVHTPDTCTECGASLAGAPVVGTATRQVLEIPEPRLEVIDHVVECRRCTSCGRKTRGEFPPEATGPVCFGPRVRATGAYLTGRQHLPLERAAETMADLFAVPMGEGTLAGLLVEAEARLEAFMAEVAARVKAAPFVHADETPVRIGVGLGWVHTSSTPDFTYLALHECRGIDAVAAIGVLTDYAGTIIHDGLATYDSDKLAAATHAQCGAHLARALKDLAKHSSQTPWASAMRTLLYSARDASEQAAAAGLRSVPDGIATPIRTRYDEILTQALAWLPGDVPPKKKYTGGWTNAEREAWNLASRMRRHEDQILRLLADTRIPFTNNTGERSFRMIKIHDKVSGTFRSWEHAEAFLAVRSYLQTGRQHGRAAMELLLRLWTPTGAWLPSVTVTDTS